jgi:hypothetical protein
MEVKRTLIKFSERKYKIENRYHSLNGAILKSQVIIGNELNSATGIGVKFSVLKYTYLLIAVMICGMSFGQKQDYIPKYGTNGTTENSFI